MAFFRRFRNSLRPTVGGAYVPRRVFASDLAVKRQDDHAGKVRASVSLPARGSVALSRLPVLTEGERTARIQRMASYDFTPHN